ncbi:TonB-dependent receptor [Flavivirga spongiicola]|uniref:TonB-dependent receptor n=1 Tax=Flavivirga spongiicola TaxID=421621 RepID=A0ABU7XUA8_9FLAO|nr:TonB-dependent receptor [Flavivirga sp. MEBiC05379]MDO5979019.1 TonB-dependent receptor [Flavivirga sp. MEBiC05379]
MKKIIKEMLFYDISKISLKMKLTSLLFIVSLFYMKADNSYSQNTKISLDMESVKIMTILEKIESLSEFRFLGNENVINDFRLVTIKANKKRIRKILDELFKGTYITYKVIDRQIVLVKEAKLNKTVPRERIDYIQGQPINGTIKDASGIPLAGATVIEKGTQNGTQTDFDGKFNLTVKDTNASLLISYIGYATQEISVNGITVFNITMQEDASELDEIVVVGYGTEKARNITGSVGYVSGKVLEDRPIANLSEGLQGVLPGLNLNFSGGEPGKQASINIRGWTGFTKGEPLVVIDGIPGDLELLNPTDVASVSVLKDAASASIYGARAANGVILITTKKGKNTQMKVNISSTISIQKPTNLPEFAKSSDYVQALQDGGLTNFTYWYNSPSVTMDQWIDFIKLREQDPDKYPKLLLRKEDGRFLFTGSEDYVGTLIKKSTHLQKHDFNISGGNDKATYYASVGFLDQKGVLKFGNDKYTRLNANLSLTLKPKKWIDLDFRLRYSNTHENSPTQYGSQEVWNNIYRTPQYRALKNDENKIWQWNDATNQYEVTAYEPTGNYIWDNNAIANLDKGGRDIQRRNDFVLTFAPTFNIGKNLKIKSDFTYNPSFYQRNLYWKEIDYEILEPGNITNYVTGDDRYNKDVDYDLYYVFNAYAEYEKTFGTKHYFKALAGYNQEWKEFEHTGATQRDILVRDIPEVTIGERTSRFGADHWAVRASFYRFSYVFDEKYMIKTTGRYDGTSKFPKDGRFGFFPSVELGWRVSNESFMDFSEDYLSNLKFRVSYGSLGNQALAGGGNHPYEPFLNIDDEISYSIAGARPPGVTIPGTLPAAGNITWEESKTKNFGVDIGLFANRFNLNFDYFIKDIDGLLRRDVYSELLGVSGPQENLASVRNKGWELSLGWRDKIGEVSYFINGNLSDFKGVITKVDNPTRVLSRLYEGQVLGEIWGYVSSIFQTDEEAATANPGGSNDQSVWRSGGGWQAGDIKYHDLNGDGVVNRGDITADNPGDLKVIGNSSPKLRYSFTLGADYKGFDFNMFFQGVGRRDFRPNTGVFQPVSSKWGNHLRSWQLDAWTPENTDAYLPRYTTGTGYNFSTQTRFLQNASYLRLKNLTLGYSLPQAVIEKLGMTKLRVYFAGQNLWETTKLKVPWDPEATDGFNSGSGKSYPFQRSYSFGVNLTF